MRIIFRRISTSSTFPDDTVVPPGSAALSSRISSRVTDMPSPFGLEQRAVRFETEHRATDRLVVDELQLIVAGDDIGIALVTLPRVLCENSTGAGRRTPHVSGWTGAPGGPGHRPERTG